MTIDELFAALAGHNMSATAAARVAWDKAVKAQRKGTYAPVAAANARVQAARANAEALRYGPNRVHAVDPRQAQAREELDEAQREASLALATYNASRGPA